MSMVKLLIRFLPAALFACLPAVGHAEVLARFYSRDFGSVFPHAFFEVEGPGVPKKNYGFTAKTVTPAILMGSVAGKIIEMQPGYVAKSRLHFTIRLSDDEYRKLMGVVANWGGRKQPSYDLYKANCVSFVRDALHTLGVRTNPQTRFLGKPKSFLTEVQGLNSQLRP
jgi:hypothetical protein